MFPIKTTRGLLLFALFMLRFGTAHVRVSAGGQQASIESMSPGLRQAAPEAMERDSCRVYAAGKHDGLADCTAITSIGTCGDPQ